MEHDLAFIEQALSRISAGSPELSAVAAINLGAIRASWERSKLPEKRLSNAARHTVASSVMGFLAEAFSRGAAEGDALDSFKSLFRYSTAIRATPSARHRPTTDWVPDDRWNGKADGPWTRAADDGHRLTVIHSRDMPGGDWTILIDDVPCLYGDDPDEVEIRTLALLDTVSGERAVVERKPVPAFLKPPMRA